MSIKIGQKIKEKVSEKGLTPTTFAKKIHKDRTTVYQIFDRESIDTELLLFIGRVLHYNFFQDLADYQAKTMDKILDEQPKLVSTESISGWQIKCYQLTDELKPGCAKKITLATLLLL